MHQTAAGYRAPSTGCPRSTHSTASCGCTTAFSRCPIPTACRRAATSSRRSIPSLWPCSAARSSRAWRPIHLERGTSSSGWATSSVTPWILVRVRWCSTGLWECGTPGPRSRTSSGWRVGLVCRADPSTGRRKPARHSPRAPSGAAPPASARPGIRSRPRSTDRPAPRAQRPGLHVLDDPGHVHVHERHPSAAYARERVQRYSSSERSAWLSASTWRALGVHVGRGEVAVGADQLRQVHGGRAVLRGSRR